MTITTDKLRTAFYEVAGNGQINKYVTKLRQNPAEEKMVKRREITSMFENQPLWKQFHSGGHLKFKHEITNVVVEFQGHVDGKKKLNTITQDQAVQLRDNLQNHINILGNEIFRYRTGNWKTEPNYNEAQTHYREWVRSRVTRARD